MIVVLEVLERRRRGTEADLKRISSVTGPLIAISYIPPQENIWLSLTHSNNIPIRNPTLQSTQSS